jgi:hypothetical protein
MALREIDLNENIINFNEDNQIPDLNVSLEELDVGFNQSPSLFQCFNFLLQVMFHLT